MKQSAAGGIVIALSLLIASINLFSPRGLAPAPAPATNANATSASTNRFSPRAIAYGKEFWRAQAAAKEVHAKTATLPFDIGEVVDRVSHAWEKNAQSGALESIANNFVASLKARTLHLNARTETAAQPVTSAIFRTVSIGGNDLGNGVTESFGNVVQIRTETGIIEHFESRREGVSITWIIPKRTEGSLPVVIEAELGGIDYITQDADGHHFGNANGDGGIRIGNATAVDSDGRRWALQTERSFSSSHKLRITVPEEVLVEATYPLAIDPLISPEFVVSPAVAASKFDNQFLPALAFNGSIYVVGWAEVTTNMFNIRVARVDRDGELLDADQLLQFGGQVKLASNGTDFLMSVHSTNNQEMLLKRLDRNGRLQEGSIPIRTQSYSTALHSNGIDYLLAIVENPKLTVYRILADNRVSPVEVDPIEGNSSPSVASDRENYLVVWSDRKAPWSIRGLRLHPSGDGFASNLLTLESSSENLLLEPSVAFSSGKYLSAWTVQTPPNQVTKQQIVARRLDETGAAIGPTFDITASTESLVSGMVAQLGPDYVVAWRETRNSFPYGAPAMARRVFANGTPDPAGAQMLSTEATVYTSQIAAVGSDSGALIVWDQSLTGSNQDILARRAYLDGTFGPARIISKGDSISAAPVVAFGANGYLVAWQDNRNALSNRWDIFGAYVDADGVPQNSAAIPIAVGPGEQGSPAVAAAYDHYLVVWRDDSTSNDDIKGSIIAGNIAGPIFNICTESNSQRAPAIASDAKGDAPAPRNFLVAWRDNRKDLLMDDIYGAHINYSGTILSPPNGFAICSETNEQSAPVVASNGTNYLVAWRDARNVFSGASGDDIYGAIIEPLSIQLPESIAISSSVAYQRSPDVASNGSDYFVVWRDDRDAGGRGVEIFGTPVSAGGVVLNASGFPLTPAALHQREPAISGLGDDYLLAWLQDGDFGSFIFVPYMRVIHSNALFGTDPIRLSRTLQNPDVLVAGEGAPGRSILVYENQDLSSPRVLATHVCLLDCPITLSIVLDEGTPTIIWNAEKNRKYVIQFRSNFTTDTWHSLPEITTTEEGFVQIPDTSANGEASRFYRVQRIL